MLFLKSLSELLLRYDTLLRCYYPVITVLTLTALQLKGKKKSQGLGLDAIETDRDTQRPQSRWVDIRRHLIM